MLRRPDGDVEPRGILVHDVPDHGSFVCHEAGIVEPITMSMFKSPHTPKRRGRECGGLGEGRCKSRVPAAFDENEYSLAPGCRIGRRGKG